MLETVLNEVDRDRLDSTQVVREKLLKTLMNKKNSTAGLPDDKEDKILLAKLIDGMDRQALSKAKLQTDMDAVKSGQESAQIIAEVLAKHTASVPAPRDHIPTMSEDIVVTNPIPGEREQGISDLSYETFMKNKK